MFEEIVVGVDQSGGSLDAIALARNLVVPGGRLNLVHVVVSGPYLGVGHAAGYAADDPLAVV